MKETEAAALVGIFALVGMFAEENAAKVTEEAVNLDGDKASIMGSDITIEGMEGTGEGNDGGKVGKISLEHDGIEWKITGLEAKE